MDASISLIMRYTYLTDVVMIDATSNHADREAIDGIPSVSMRKDKSPLTRHEEVKPPPAKKSRAASIAEAQVQHARREAVPPKPSTSSTPAPTISDAVVQHARREAIPPKLPPSSISARSISDATVQHAEREAVPPKAVARCAWPCGNTKVIAKDEPKRRFLKRKLAEAEASGGKPLSDEQMRVAQELNLVPPTQTMKAFGLSSTPLVAPSAAGLAWLSAVHPLHSRSIIEERARRVVWQPWDVVQTTHSYILLPEEQQIKSASARRIRPLPPASPSSSVVHIHHDDSDDRSRARANHSASSWPPPRDSSPPRSAAASSPSPPPSPIEPEQTEDSPSPPRPPPSPGPERRSRSHSTPAQTRVAIFFSGPQDDGLVRILRGAGILVDAFDTLEDATNQDLLRTAVLNPLLHRIAKGYYSFVFLATPCSSFSILKAMRTLIDPHLKDVELTDYERAYFKKHDRLAATSATIASFAHKSATPFVIENPPPRHDPDSPAHWPKFAHLASLFDMPCFLALIESTGAKLTTFSQCMFNGRFQKMTGFLSSPRITNIVSSIFGSKICNHKHHDYLAMGLDEHGESLAAQAAAYPPEMNTAILHLIQESIAVATVSFGSAVHLGSADPHGVEGAHSAAAPSTWAPSGSLRQLEPEQEHVLLDEPLPRVNVVPSTFQDDPPALPSHVPGPFTTEQLIPEGIYHTTVGFGKGIFKCLDRAGRGEQGWRIARDLRPVPLIFTEQQALNPCGWGFTWRYSQADQLWHAVTASFFPDKPPQSSIDPTKFEELARKTGLTDQQLISWVKHGFPGAVHLKVFAQLASPHVGALKNAAALEECNQKDIKAGFVSSGFEFPEYWPAVVDPMNIVVQHGKARLCIDKSMVIGEESYNSTIDLDRDEGDRRVTLVRVWQFCRGAAILNAACTQSIDAYVTLAKFDLKAFFRQHGKQELFVHQSSRCLSTGFGTDFRVNFGERDAPDHTGRASNALRHFILCEFKRLDAAYPTKDPGLVRYVARRLQLACDHGDSKDTECLWAALFFLVFYVDDGGLALISDLLYDPKGEPVMVMLTDKHGVASRVHQRRDAMYFPAATSIANYIGYGTPEDKIAKGRSLVFLGVNVNLTTLLRSLDETKRKDYLELLRQVVKGRAKLANGLTVTDTDLCNSLYHKLIHAADTKPLGKAHTFYIGRALRTPNRLSPGGVIIDALALKEFEWWEAELLEPADNGLPLASRYSFPGVSAGGVLVIYSDASREIDPLNPDLRGGDNNESGLGAWAVIAGIFYYVEDRWEAWELKAFSINVLEILAECIGIFSLLDKAQELGESFPHVHSFVDNTSAEFVSERGRAGTEGMANVNRRRLHEITSRSVHQKTSRVPSKQNDIADGLSRGDILEALRIARSCGLHCVRVPLAERWRDLSDVPRTWA